jgi:gliding motility-associated lipoprotein GldD
MKTTTINIQILSIYFAVFTLASCQNYNDSTPKPYGYFRITLPENKYQLFDNEKNPYTFEYSTIAKIEERNDKPAANWLNIIYPQHNATIYITYHRIKNNLDTIITDSHLFTYRHTIKADAIDTETCFFPDKNVFGLLADVEGDVASPIQFLVTDSTRNFVRGSLYFNVEPNSDSIAPVVEFIRKDIINLMKTLEWKNNYNNQK